MTPNSPSAFIKLFCLSLLFSGSHIHSYAKSSLQLFNTEDSTLFKNVNPNIYSRENYSRQFSVTENYLIVLKNSRSCSDCFRDINNYVRNIKADLRAKFIVISLIDSSTLDRKRNYQETRTLMPDFEEYLFQYKNSSLKTFFDQYDTKTTPELLIVRNGEILKINYADVFDFSSMDISISTQFKIFQLLK